MKILIAGGAGFIGSHLVDRCVKEEYEVNVIDNLSNSNPSHLTELQKKGHINFIKGDIRDLATVKKIIRDVKAVFHEAAQISVPLSVSEPIYTDDVNVRGTLNLLIAASDEKVDRFIYASSSSVYGDPVQLPLTEEQPLRPRSPYAASKIAGEAYCTAFYKVKKLPIVCLRYFNVYGPRQTMNGYAMVIPTFIQCLSDKKPMTIFGDGTQTRDFVHVTDVVEANMLALTRNQAVGEILNVGSGQSTSILDLSSILSEMSEVEMSAPVFLSPREGDVKHSEADISKAGMMLGYQPRTDLRSGLKDLVKTSRKN